MTMIEKIARRFAFNQGARIVGPGQSQATREFGWKGDGEHFEQYVERHWKEYEEAARMALEAMREPTDEMKSASEEVHWGYSCHTCGGLTEGWHKMIDAALGL